MSQVLQSPDGTKWYSTSDELSDSTISNMISVLTNPKLSELFTEEELFKIKLAVKTNIEQKAQSVIEKKLTKEELEQEIITIGDITDDYDDYEETPTQIKFR